MYISQELRNRDIKMIKKVKYYMIFEIFTQSTRKSIFKFGKAIKITRHAFPGVVSWVSGIARSHTEPNQANTVIAERCTWNFWRNGHEEQVQCETVHYRDANTKSCWPIILVFLEELLHVNDAQRFNNIPY